MPNTTETMIRTDYGTFTADTPRKAQALARKAEKERHQRDKAARTNAELAAWLIARKVLATIDPKHCGRYGGVYFAPAHHPAAPKRVERDHDGGAYCRFTLAIDCDFGGRAEAWFSGVEYVGAIVTTAWFHLAVVLRCRATGDEIILAVGAFDTNVATETVPGVRAIQLPTLLD